MKRLFLLFLLIAFAVACSKDSGGEVDPPAPPVDKPVWEKYTHAELLNFKGAINKVHEYLEEDGERYQQFAVKFDAVGNCTYFNATGIDPEVATYGWGRQATWYDYRYDASGRLNSVVRYEVGAEPLTYTITYGSHQGYVIVPFPLGDIEPFMLKGVVRIEADGYLLTCDGEAAESESVTAGWGAKTVRTAWTFKESMPAAAESVTYRGDEEVERTQTTYEYEKMWLMEQTSVVTEFGEFISAGSVEYSSQWPCSPVKRTIVYSAVPEDQTVVQYDYAENGLITALRVTGSLLDAEQPFEQWYNAYDTRGNWTSSTKQSEGVEQILTREVEYYQ